MYRNSRPSNGLLPGSERLAVEAKLGEGSYSRVYLVRDVYTQDLYAAKVLVENRFPVTKKILARWHREIRLSQKMQHPSLIALKGVVVFRGKPFPIFEFAPCGTLYDYVARMKIAGQRISLDKAMTWMGQILSGVEYLHEKNVIHRDITPKNVVIRADDSVALGDLGVALEGQAEPDMERYFSQHGPVHLSAKQLENPAGATELDDIYSLGQMFFYMLTGQIPQRGVASVQKYNPECPNGLADLIEAMRDPNERNRPSDISEINESIRDGSVLRDQFVMLPTENIVPFPSDNFDSQFESEFDSEFDSGVGNG